MNTQVKIKLFTPDPPKSQMIRRALDWMDNNNSDIFVIEITSLENSGILISYIPKNKYRHESMSQIFKGAAGLFSLIEKELWGSPVKSKEIDLRKIKKDLARLLCSINKAYPDAKSHFDMPYRLNELVKETAAKRKKWRDRA